MRIGAATALIATVLASVASSTLAQTSPDTVPEVIVQGRRDHVETTRKFVDEATVKVRDKDGEQQIARFAEAICPWSLGLTTAQNAAISDRVFQVAKGAGIRTGAKGCDPHVVVIVADTGHYFL